MTLYTNKEHDEQHDLGSTTSYREKYNCKENFSVKTIFDHAIHH